MRCNCFKSYAVHLANTASITKPISLSKHQHRGQKICMSSWAQDWSTALDAYASDANQHAHSVHQERHIASTHTPHPASASSREAAAWEAVLTATEATAAASSSSAATSTVQQTANEEPWRVSSSPLYAVVECGSHCTRLLLSTGVADVARLSVDTHLGAAAQQQQVPSAQLGASATNATLQALHDYSTLLQQHDVASKAAVATAAVRQAADVQQLIQEATAILGCQLQVLSGTQEGQLAFIGATSSLAHTGQCCLVFDLGGNSTEIAVGSAGAAPTLVASIPLGCLAVQAGTSPPAAIAAAAPRQSEAAAQYGAQEQQQLQQPPPCPDYKQPDTHHHQQRQQELQLSAEAILAAHRTDLQAVLDEYKQQQQQSRADRNAPPVAVIGTGGTITTIAALLQQLPRYQHEAVHMCTVSQQDVLQLMDQLEAGDSNERLLKRFPWLTGKRYDSLLPGCCGVLAVMQQLDVQQVLVSDCDLLDGMIVKLQQLQQH